MIIIHISHSLYKTIYSYNGYCWQCIIHISHSLYKTLQQKDKLDKFKLFTYHIVYIKPSSSMPYSSINSLFTYHIVYIKPNTQDARITLYAQIHISHSLYKTPTKYIVISMI